MKVMYTLETSWPTDVPAPAGINGCDWERHGEIPFIPVAGMMVSAGQDDDLRKIREVYWSADQPDVIEVNFESDVEFPRSAAYWLKTGWSTRDFKVTKKLLGKP